MKKIETTKLQEWEWKGKNLPKPLNFSSGNDKQ